MAIRRLETLLVIFSGFLVVLLDLELDDIIE